MLKISSEKYIFEKSDVEKVLPEWLIFDEERETTCAFHFLDP